MKEPIIYVLASLVGFIFLYNRQYAIGVAFLGVAMYFYYSGRKEISNIERERESDAGQWLQSLCELEVNTDLGDYPASLEDIAYNLDPQERNRLLSNFRKLEESDRCLLKEIIRIDPHGETFH